VQNVSSFNDAETIGMLSTDGGDSVVIGLERGAVHLEVANEGREPVEIWLTRDDARLLADLMRRAADA
jgi:hypothetical protein